MNILKRANEIVNERSEEKERQYGPFNESIERTAAIASLITNRNITPDDVFAVMVGLKLSRHAHAYSEDSMLDMVAYVGAWNNYIQSNINEKGE
jgi:DNA-binding protein H-NS